MRLQHFISLLFCFFLLSCNSKGQLKSGTFVHREYFTDTTAWGIDYAGVMENKIWFRDSLIIVEMKAIYDSTSFNDTGVYRVQDFLFFKYVFFDLKTMKCQDYLTFSDSAKPICHYILPKSSTFFWSFFPLESRDEIRDRYREVPDTVLDNVVYKKLTRTFQERGNSFEFVYYLDKNKPQTILHLNRDLEDLYHEYSVFRYDVIPLRRVSSIKISEMKMLSKELNENEEKVMRAWERNLKTTKMPLITYNESSKTCGADMRYRK